MSAPRVCDVAISNTMIDSFPRADGSLAVSERLAPKIPSDRIVVAESGLNTPTDLARLSRLGISTFLVGESLMRLDEPGKGIPVLRGLEEER